MTSLYEGTVDDLNLTFMQIANYRSWLKGRSNSKGHDSSSLKLKAIAKCEHERPMAEATKFYPRAKGRNTKDCALEDTKLFGSTKQRLGLPLGAKCDSHGPDKVKHSIPCPQTIR